MPATRPDFSRIPSFFRGPFEDLLAYAEQIGVNSEGHPGWGRDAGKLQTPPPITGEGTTREFSLWTPYAVGGSNPATDILVRTGPVNGQFIPTNANSALSLSNGNNYCLLNASLTQGAIDSCVLEIASAPWEPPAPGASLPTESKYTLFKLPVTAGSIDWSGYDQYVITPLTLHTYLTGFTGTLPNLSGAHTTAWRA